MKIYTAGPLGFSEAGRAFHAQMVAQLKEQQPRGTGPLELLAEGRRQSAGDALRRSEAQGVGEAQSENRRGEPGA